MKQHSRDRASLVFKDKPNGLVVDFIGISGFLAEATKKYTAGGGEGKHTLDLEAAVKICLEQFQKGEELKEKILLIDLF